MSNCIGCEHQFREDDLAPYQRNPDGTYAEACRGCISKWIKLGILWASIPFWMRKEGADRV